MSYRIFPTLSEATTDFIRKFLGPEAFNECLDNNLAAKDVARTLVCFHEGAFWAAARMGQMYTEHPDYLEDGPDKAALDIVLQIMAEHSKASTVFDAAIHKERH